MGDAPGMKMRDIRPHGYVPEHAKRCLARPFPSSLDFEAGVP